MVIRNTFTENDLEYIHKCLSGTYWAKSRTFEQNKTAFNNSLVFMLFDEGGVCMGFARVFTDYVTIAYLCDVYIDEQYRGRGIGKYLVDEILKYPKLQGVSKFFLKTSDAMEFYSKFGFNNLKDPEAFMEKYMK
jgi:ribosomal protein S18 acetylase RimI-like enzyme